MANVFDYLRWRGDIGFDTLPINEIDALIFCELSYIFFEDIVPDEGSITLAEAAGIFFKNNEGKEIKLGEIVPREIVDLFRLAAETERFASVPMTKFINIIDDIRVEQFCALTFLPTERDIFIAYRGTDDTITGWREDFRMAFSSPIPAQERAEEYLSSAADNDRSIFLGGHSKGGNLALWSALTAPDAVCGRIRQVYNFDGPGFLENVWEERGYERIADRITTVIPTGSIVGMLLKYHANYRVARSSAKKYIYQHDALTWEVMGAEFVCDEDVAPEIRRVNDVVDKWLCSMDPREREDFIEGFFDILCSANVKTLTELADNPGAVLKAFSGIDPETRQALYTGIKFLVDESRSSVTEQFRALIKKNEPEEEKPKPEPKKVKKVIKKKKIIPKKCRNCKRRKM